MSASKKKIKKDLDIVIKPFDPYLIDGKLVLHISM